jgi:hypothetical protein
MDSPGVRRSGHTAAVRRVVLSGSAHRQHSRNMPFARIILFGIMVNLLGFSPVFAQSAQTSGPDLDRSVFGFAGLFVREDIWESALFLSADYEENFLFGAGFQEFFLSGPLDLNIGAEAGIAGRFGESSSAEFWGGVVVRHPGFAVFDTVRVSPAMTFGLSAITDTIGREREQEISDGGDATLLFYLGPEINFSLLQHPRFEVFYRLHHRSGAWGTLGDMRGAANANVVGMRVRF